jgi:hypothetical protein
MAKRDLAAVWTVLESTPPDAGVEAVGVGYEVNAGELLAGIDGVGHRYLLIPLLAGEAAKADTKGRSVHLLRLNHAGAHYLAVACLSRELHTVFTQFSRELVASIENADSPARAAAEAFDRWKALFSEGTLRGVIGEERLVGLIGELLTLEALLSNEASADLGYWKGPSGGAQDFRTATHAVEVKSTLVREGRIVNISSIEQLQPPPNTYLHLVHHRLEPDPGGFSISDVFQRLTAMGASASDLETGLAANGVFVSDFKHYVARRYRLVETRTYDAMGVAFPRITRDSFLGGNIPPGTLRIAYSIDLTNEPPLPLSASEAEDVFQEMAKEAAHGMDS